MTDHARLPVSLQHWQIFRAWLGDAVWQWAICHDGIPTGLQFDDKATARQVARDMGWEIIGEETCDEEIGPCAHQDQSRTATGQSEG